MRVPPENRNGVLFDVLRSPVNSIEELEAKRFGDHATETILAASCGELDVLRGESPSAEIGLVENLLVVINRLNERVKQLENAQ